MTAERPNASTNAFARRMTEREIPKSMQPGEIWNDVPAKIAQAMGGREWFFEEEATNIHRVGIGRGLGWRLPRYRQRGDGIDYVRVTAGTSGLLDLCFLHAGDCPPEEAEPIRGVGGLYYADLRPTYERELYGQEAR